MHEAIKLEGGREGGREEGRKGGREEGRKGGREEGRKEGRKVEHASQLNRQSKYPMSVILNV